MSTGAEFSNFSNKQIVGFEDLGKRMLAYLKASHIEGMSLRWPVDGSFVTKLSCSGPAANTVRVNGTSKGTDGIGHVLDINQINSRDATFENSNGVVYHVGLFYSEVPTDVMVLPRTGEIAYKAWREIIGRSGTPNSVTNNVTTIRFNVNSVTETGVSHAGRTVRVFKKIPAAAGATYAVAVEDCTVQFVSGQNIIDTTGTLGQSTISTTAADYTVVELGVSVQRLASGDLGATSGCMFVSTVTGNAGTPATFSNVNQNILDVFPGASQVVYSPTLWLAPGATNVQLAIDTILSGLRSNVTAEGSDHVGVYAGNFIDKEIDLTLSLATRIGGIGGNLPGNPTVRDVLEEIDERIQEMRAWTGVCGEHYVDPGGGRPSEIDVADIDMLYSDGLGGSFFMRQVNDAANNPYIFGLAPASMVNSPRMVGELDGWRNPAGVGAHKAWTNKIKLAYDRIAANNWVGTGWYQNAFIDSMDAAVPMFMNGSSRPSGGIWENCLFRGATLQIAGGDLSAEGGRPINISNCVFDSVSGATKALTSTLELGGTAGSGLPGFALIQNTLFLGPLSSQTSPVPVAIVTALSTFGNASGVEASPNDRPFKFSNCTFVNQRTGTRCVDLSSRHKIVFENCHFYGFAGSSSELVRMNANSHAVFRDCIFYGTEGVGLLATDAYGLFDSCIFISGTGTTVASPRLISAYGGNTRTLAFRDISVLVNAGSIRTTGTPLPIVQFGVAALSSKQTLVDGLHIQYTNTPNIHMAETLVLYGQSNSRCQYSNILVDFFQCTRSVAGLSNIGSPNSATTAMVAVTRAAGGSAEYATVQNIRVQNFATPSADRDTTALLVWACLASNVVIQNSGSGGSGRWQSHLFVSTGGYVRGFVDNSLTYNASSAWLYMYDTGNIVDGVLASSSSFAAGGTPPPAVVVISGNNNMLLNFKVDTGAAHTYGIQVIGRENQVMNGQLHCNGVTSSIIRLETGFRRNMVSDIVGTWNGLGSFVQINSDDSIVDTIVARRTGGGAGIAAAGGTGTVTGSTILSTTL